MNDDWGLMGAPCRAYVEELEDKARQQEQQKAFEQELFYGREDVKLLLKALEPKMLCARRLKSLGETE
jgi:hypothetical protein